MKQTVSAKETEWSPFPYKVCRQWVGMGGWLGIGQTQEGFVPRNPTEFLLASLVDLLKFYWAPVLYVVFPTLSCSFVHICFLSCCFLQPFCSSVWFLSYTVIGPFKKQATFFPFQWDTRGGKVVVWCKSFFFESKCYSVNSLHFSANAGAYLWPQQHSSILSLPMALNHSFVIGRFIYLFVLICSGFLWDCAFFLQVNTTQQCDSLWNSSHWFRPEYWHFLNFT